MAKIRWLAISARMNYSMLLAAVKLCTQVSYGLLSGFDCDIPMLNMFQVKAVRYNYSRRYPLLYVL